MMDWTDRHCRSFLRLVSKQALLYTEMVHAQAILRGDPDRVLAFGAHEHPLAVQLGGSDPESLAAAARVCTQRGFVEINLNVGCPSDRVQAGRFGACLMADPSLVADCVVAMREAALDATDAGQPPSVTVKTRIGIDELDSLEFLLRFVEMQVEAGVDALIVHARKAWLSGLSPKQNREVPMLDYSRVYAVKDAFPALPVVLNGGIRDLGDAAAQLRHVDGAMIGRAAYNDPWMLADADRTIFGSGEPPQSRHVVLEQYLSYVSSELARGTQLHHLTRHILGLFQGQAGARAWRRTLTEGSHKPGADLEVLLAAMSQVERSAA
jgi:tRNA-dihydrouridine synthase A